MGQNILLTSRKSLFAADVEYHKSCYSVFCSAKWNEKKSGRKHLSVPNPESF